MKSCAPRLIYLVTIFATLASAAIAIARIGETESQCNTRYGTPITDAFTISQNTTAPLVSGCPTRTYDYHGFRIRIAFLAINGPAIKMQFTKRKDGPILKDDEISAILQANLPDGMKWLVRIPDNPDSPNGPAKRLIESAFMAGTGAEKWERSDGVTGRLEMMKMGLVLESPAVQTLEKRAKEAKEAKRKAAIPSF